MGIVDPKDSYSLLNPEIEDALQFLPHLPPLRRFEVEGINVLILFRWILCVLYGAVGPFAEPLFVLFYVRMVWGYLESDVERHLHAQSRCSVYKAPEVIQSSQLGVDGFMAAVDCADRPGAPYILWLGRRRIVFAFAKLRSDWMNRGQVNNVKSHSSYVIEPRLAIGQRTMQSRFVRC